MGQHSDNAREKIIDAAEQVVIAAGARHLTLQAVAAKAGISRGGLLYHFPDKEALLRGMLDRRRRHIAENRRRKRAEIPDGQGKEAAVYVLSLLDEDSGANKDVSAAIIASGTHNPGLLAPAREDHGHVIADLTREGLSFERAAVIALATSGLRFWEVMNLSPFTDGERGRIIAELLALAEKSQSK
ncbi:MAG TPA: TetR/AcrR family transcriptional regulator [Smithellaceae bacterium]|nr:TetR/AcrR family transcriptional regulator [Smithellaceae bacterium]